jgi:hypothetical protein
LALAETQAAELEVAQAEQAKEQSKKQAKKSAYKEISAQA